MTSCVLPFETACSVLGYLSVLRVKPFRMRSRLLLHTVITSSSYIRTNLNINTCKSFVLLGLIDLRVDCYQTVCFHSCTFFLSVSLAFALIQFLKHPSLRAAGVFQYYPIVAFIPIVVTIAAEIHNTRFSQ